MSCEVTNLFTLSMIHRYAPTHEEQGGGGGGGKTNTVKIPPLYSK